MRRPIPTMPSGNTIIVITSSEPKKISRKSPNRCSWRKTVTVKSRPEIPKMPPWSHCGTNT